MLKSTRMQPIIGINMALSPDSSDASVASINTDYIDAITSAGGIPLVLAPVDNAQAIERMVGMCDGFVFIGGADIDPARYGAPLHPLTHKLATRREQFDFALLEKVLAKRKPFLGVCLGCQELAVAKNGKLLQDIHSEVTSDVQHQVKHVPHYGFHQVTIDPSSRLFDLVSTDTLETNSSHHQAVKDPGQGVRVAARSADGVIEAVELVDYPFGVGVQWHPEQLMDRAAHQRLFEKLVKKSKVCRARRAAKARRIASRRYRNW